MSLIPDSVADTRREPDALGWNAGTAVPTEDEPLFRTGARLQAFWELSEQTAIIYTQRMFRWQEVLYYSTEDFWHVNVGRVVSPAKLDDVEGKASTSVSVHAGDDYLAVPVRTMFAAALDEHFEDGIESQFSRQLTRLIANSLSAMDYIINLIVGGQVNDEVAAEALRWIGQMGGQHQQSYDGRRWLLERCLFMNSLTIRDGAVLGLSFLDDPRSIGSLQEALKRETSQMLAADIVELISDLS